VESELADHIGVSRTPVRSALHRLMQDGYVLGLERGRKLKLIVAPLTREDAREIYHIVGSLDGLAAWNAARLPSSRRAVLADEMTAVNENIQALQSAPTKDYPTMFKLHGDFHDLPLEAVDAPRLKTLHATTKPQADRYRRIYSSGDYGQQLRSVEEHREITRAIADGDPDGALVKTQEHWMAAAHRLCRIIEVVGERGSW
jgi:DNA-binding GntR family transcriptional regulator